MYETLAGYSSNLTECYDCGVMYCGQCGHSNCPGGRLYEDGTTAPPKLLNGKDFRQKIEEGKEFVRKFQNHQ